MQPLPDPAAPSVSPARVRPLSMTVAWESPWTRFRTSLYSFVKDPRPPKTGPSSGGVHLRVQWIDGKVPKKSFAASAAWHAAAIWVLTLPIWGFLPSAQPAAAPVHIELTWDAPARELPRISLPAALPKPKPALAKREETPAPPAPNGADAFHPRQTMLSIPVQITHPRQTLIQPQEPAAPPKITEQLPNMVEWAATAPQPKPAIRFAPKTSAPVTRRRQLQDIAAPDIPNQEKIPGALNIAASPNLNPSPRLAMSPTTAPISERRRTDSDKVAAPDLAPEVSAGDSGLRRVIALSTDPAPPPAVAELPRGNLAARVAISPEGSKPGTPGGSGNSSGSSGGGPGSLPAAVSIAGGNDRPDAGGGGADVAGPRAARRLNLNPALSYRPGAATARRAGPSVTGPIDPDIAPDKILSGKDVYTMHIDMPNLTSSTGSWTLNFAQLNEEFDPAHRPVGRLAAPVLERKVDPEYPPSMIKAHVEGQVILYAIIRKDGSVDSIQRVRGLEPILDKNAMLALSQWKFRPATRDGVPVDIEVVVYIPFRYRSPLE